MTSGRMRLRRRSLAPRHGSEDRQPKAGTGPWNMTRGDVRVTEPRITRPEGRVERSPLGDRNQESGRSAKTEPEAVIGRPLSGP